MQKIHEIVTTVRQAMMPHLIIQNMIEQCVWSNKKGSWVATFMHK